jgi:hypothetical protein
VKCIPYIGYNWYYNRESVSNTKQKVLDEKQLEAVSKLIDILAGIFKQDGSNGEIAEWFLVRTASHYILNGVRNSSNEMVERALKTLFGKIGSMYPNYQIDDYLKIKCPSESAAVRFMWHNLAKKGGGFPIKLARYVSR